MKIQVTRITLVLAQVFFVILAVAGARSPASAHAVLVSSSPKDHAILKAPPQKVILRFDARIEKPVSQVTLHTDKGQQVALKTPKGGYKAGAADQLIVPLPQLKPGTYQLEYKVLATDGHLTPGAIRFTISGGKSP